MKPLILTTMLAIAGCTDSVPPPQGFSSIERCVEGVIYYHYQTTVGNAGYGYLAPKFVYHSGDKTAKLAVCNGPGTKTVPLL